MISQEMKVAEFSSGHVVLEENIKKKNMRVKRAILPFLLSDSRVLLIDALPLDFLLSYTILVGDQSRIFSFELEDSNQEYIAQENILEILQTRIKNDTIKRIDPSSIARLDYKMPFKPLEIISEISEKILLDKKINLYKTHMIPSSKISLFQPNLNQADLELAIDMGINPKPLFLNSQIRGSDIGVYDYDKIIEKIKPLKIYDSNELVSLNFEDGNQLFKDITRVLKLRLNPNLVSELLSSLDQTEPSKQEIYEEIMTLDGKIISSDTGETPIPLWIDSRNKFFEIKDISDFKEKTGIDFNLEFNFLKDILISGKSGKPCEFFGKYFTKEFQRSYARAKVEKILSYEDYLELFLSLLISNGEILEAYPERVLRSSEFQKIKTDMKKFLKKLIDFSIKHNKKPYLQPAKSYLSIYLDMQREELIELSNKYQNKEISPSSLINNLLQIWENSLELAKIQGTQIEDTYFLSQLFLHANKIISFFDLAYSKELLKEFTDYFGPLLCDNAKSLFDKAMIEEIDGLILARKLSAKGKKIYIFPKKDIPQEILGNNVRFLSSEPVFTAKIIPNEELLEKFFPYSREEVSRQISNFNPSEVERGFLNLKRGKIRLKPEYYRMEKEYTSFKLIIENSGFILFERND